MPIYLDDQPTDIAGDTLGHVMDAAQDKLQRDGRALVEIRLDGEALLGDDLDTRRTALVGSREVRLYSAVPRELAIATLREIRESLQDARHAQRDAAELFQQDKPSDGMKRIGDAIQVWQTAQQTVINATGLVGLDLDQRLFEGRPIKVLTDELLAQFKSLRDLIAAGDTVALADSLLYEWPEVTDRWDRLIGEVMGWLEEK
jgi:hypothetical protein